MSNFLMDKSATIAEPIVDPNADKFLYERVARVESTYYICRIWCGDAMVTPIDELRNKIESTLFYLESLGLATSEEVAAALLEICSIEGMNSVEITQPNGVGMCVHKNWP